MENLDPHVSTTIQSVSELSIIGCTTDKLITKTCYTDMYCTSFSRYFDHLTANILNVLNLGLLDDCRARVVRVHI